MSWTSANTTGVSIDPGVGSVALSGTASVSPVYTTTYTVTASNAGGSVTQQAAVAVNDPPPPSIGSFTASALTIPLGQSCTLSWATTFYPGLPDTLTVTTAQSGTGVASTVVSVLGSSNLVVAPLVTTTYTLTASDVTAGVTRTVTQSLTVTVTQKPVITAFVAAPATIQAGQSTTLSWGVSNFQTLSLDHGLGTVTGSSVTVSPTQTTTYTLIATNAVGTVTQAVTVNVASGAAGSLTWQKTLVYGFGQLLSEESPSGTVYIQSDQVQSPNFITDATGAVVGKSKNLPFGERLDNWGVKSFRRFATHEDGDGSSIYMQARTYLPAYGKFAQVDPAYDQSKDDPESWNLYNYTTNNPVTHLDPDGRESASAAGGGAPAPQEQSDGNKQDDKNPATPPAPSTQTGGTQFDPTLNLDFAPVLLDSLAQPKTLSGPDWVNQFRDSSSLNDLADGFRESALAFIDALRAGGASVSINSTRRSEERAYLMHFAWEIARNGMDPSKVPYKSGVHIDWVHRQADGWIDLSASRAAAQAMVNAYHIVYGPVLHSRHTEGHAVDMSIRWQGTLNIRSGTGDMVNIQSGPRSGLNRQVIDVGRTYGVMKLASDPPHWSTDGH